MSGEQPKESPGLIGHIKPPDSGFCALCNRPLGAEPHYIVEYPNGEHVECWRRQMAEEGFPLGGELDRLRGLAEIFQEAYRELVSFGKWMRMMKDTWPARRLEMEQEYRERRIRLRDKLERLKGRIP